LDQRGGQRYFEQTFGRRSTVAWLPDDRGAHFVASAMLVSDTRAPVAEFAILVHHDHTHHGLGRYLLECLLLHARQSGIATVFGVALAENVEMLNLAREMGFRLHPVSDDPGCVRMEIPTAMPRPP